MNKRPPITVMLVAIYLPFIQVIRLLFERFKDMTLIVSESDCERIVMQVDRVKPAVILVDLDMPGRMGLEIISRLHRAQLNVAIIALSNLRCYRQITLTTGANEAIDKLKIATELEPAIRCAVL